MARRPPPRHAKKRCLQTYGITPPSRPDSVRLTRAASLSVATSVALTSLGPHILAPSVAQAATESPGNGAAGTVNGRIITTEAGGGAPWILDGAAGERPIGGVRVYGYWTDWDGTVSETYFTTSAPDGTYSLDFPEYTDKNGRKHTFDANTRERMKIWVDKATFPDDLVLAYAEGRQLLHNWAERDHSLWWGNRVTRHNFALRQPDDPSLHGVEQPNTPHPRPWQLKNTVSGTVSWDYVRTWGGIETMPVSSGLDKGAAGVKVTATMKDTSGATHTVSTFTNRNGEYTLNFPPQFDPDFWSADTLYVTIDPPGGNSYFTPFVSPTFHDTRDIPRAENFFNTLYNVNFSLYPDMDTTFDVVQYNTTDKPAAPGTSVTTSAGGLVPDTRKYRVEWFDDRGRRVKRCRNLKSTGTGTLGSCTFTVPSTLTKDTVYTAKLTNDQGDVLGSDSFLAKAFDITLTLPDSVVGTAYTGPTPTVMGGSGAMTFTARNLPPGLSINPTTGEITGTPTMHGDYPITVRATDSTGRYVEVTNEVTVSPAPLTVDMTPSSGVVGQTYTSPPASASGGVGPYSYSASSLPAGLAIIRGTGVISGTPLAAGTSSVTITVTDAQGVTASVVKSIEIATAPLALVPVAHPDATVGVAYTGPAPSASGGDGSYAFTATGLPPGMSVAAGSGVLSGSPSVPGVYTVNVTVTDGRGEAVTVPVEVRVLPAPLVMGPMVFGPATTGDAYSVAAPAVTGGVGPYGFTASGLPDGLSVDTSTGAISGTPTRDGVFPVTVTVTDAAGVTAQVTGSITVTTVFDPLVMPSQDLVDGEMGTAYTGPTPVVTGGDGSYSFTASGLPDGLSIDAATGVVTGTPSTVGTYSVTVTVTDGQGVTASYTDAMQVAAAPLSLTASAPAGQVGVAYNGPAAGVSGGIGPFTYSGTGLPAGLSVDAATGAITGTPTAHGTFSVTVSVTDSSGTVASRTLSLVIDTADVTLGAVLPDGQATVAYTGPAPTAGGGTGTYRYTATGLPAGLAIDADTGVISGTTTASGTFTVTITVTDSQGKTATATPSLVVAPEPLAISAQAPNGRVGQAYSAPDPAATGGTAPYSFAAQGLPPGVDIVSGTGALTGTPTLHGSFTVMYTVTDGAGQTATTAVVIEIAPRPLTLDAASATSATVGSAYTGPAPTVDGGVGPYTYTAPGLPNGLTVDASTGVISGTPDTGSEGVYMVTLTVTDALGATATATQQLTVGSPPVGNFAFDYAGGIVGQTYSEGEPSPSGGTGTYRYSAINEPPGLTIDPNTGRISGTPTTAGTFPVQVTVTSGAMTETFTDSIHIDYPALTLDATFGNGMVGAAYNDLATATGGDGTYTFSATGLPAGLTMSPAGVVTGTPSVAGTFPVTVTVRDGQHVVKETVASLTVTPAPLTLTAAWPDGVVGTVYGPAAATPGGGTEPYSFTATGLPPGLSVDPATGALTGTPTVHGTFTARLTVMDAAGEVASHQAVITVAPQPLVVAGTASDGVVGNNYQASIASVDGGVGPYSYAVTTGSLPAGLTLDGVTGAITGTPTAHGDVTFTTTVTDALGTTRTVAQTITIAPAPLDVTAANLPSGQVDTAYSAPGPTVTGGTGGYTFSATGLPAGLSVDPTTGAITGTPTAAGTSTVTLTITDSSGSTTTVVRDVRIAPAPLVLMATDFPDGEDGTAYTTGPLTATGGTTPYTYSATGLPPGVTIDAVTGALSGTPTAPGAYAVAVTVTDTAGSTASFTDTVTIAAVYDPLELASAALPAATVGAAYAGPLPTVTGGDGTNAFTSTALPPGLTLNAATGQISGTPSAPGTHAITLTVTDGQGTTADVALTLEIAYPAIVVTTSAPDGMVDAPYSAPAPAIVGGTGTHTVVVTDLPPGLTADASGALSGTPTTPGDFVITYTVTDSAGATQTVTDAVRVDAAPLTLTATTPAGTVGAAYSAPAPVADGGVGPYTYTVAGLPSGLTANATTGVISGTPASHGTFTATYTVRDSRGVATTTVSTFTINPAPITATYTVPDGTVGDAYTAPGPTTSGGVGPYTYSANSLPDGLTLNPGTGALTGTPSTAGTFAYTLTITDTLGATKALVRAIDIANAPMALSAALSDGQVDSPYTASLPTAQGGDGNYTYTATGLPAGLSIDPATGAVTGTPTARGSYTVTITATDGTGASTTATSTVAIAAPPLDVRGDELPDGEQGVAYASSALTTTGGVPGYTYSATGLPAGLTIDPATGAISGTPTVDGNHTVTITVTDSLGQQASYTDELFLSTEQVVPALDITGVDLPGGTIGENYTSPAPAVTGGQGTTRTFTATGLPPGLTVDPTTGVVSGTPTAVGTYSVTVTVTDEQGGTSSYSDTVTIDPQPLDASVSAPDGVVGLAYAGAVASASGGVGPYTYTASGLPSGLTLTAGGVLGGTPTAAGTFPVTVTVTDADGRTASATTTVTIAPAPVVVTATYDDGEVGTAYTSSAATVTGAVGAVTFSATGLPPGLAVNTSTGALTGTPTAAGSYTVTLTATDSNGTIADVTTTVTIAPEALQITSSELPGGSTTDAYTSPAPQATGGQGTYTFTAVGLPAGLAIDPTTGIITGTPGASGTYQVTVTVTDAGGQTASFTDVIAVEEPAPIPVLTLTAADIPDGTVGAPLTAPAPTAAGGTAPYTFSAVGLPPGVTIDPATGAITGDPISYGTFNVTVTVTDSRGETASYSDTTTIAPAPLTLDVTLPPVTVGAYTVSTNPTVTGGEGPYTYTAIGLPPGMTIDRFTGVISGTPTTPGDYAVTITITATDQRGTTASHGGIMGVTPAPIVASVDTPTGTYGSPYTSGSPTISGGIGPFTFTATGLPPGLTIDPATGVISGTPSTTGVYTTTVTITDSDGTTHTVTTTVTIDAQTLEITSPDFPAGTVGDLLTGPRPTPIGGVGPYTYSSSSLPAGLTIDLATGVISGTPRQAGTTDITVTVTDTQGATASFTTPLVVSDAPAEPLLAIDGPPTIGATEDVPFTSPAPTVTGATGTPRFTATGLPPGLQLDPATGVISGTPTSAATFRVTITATDDDGRTASYTTHITVAPAPLTIAATANPGTVDVTYQSAPPTVTKARGDLTFSAIGLPPGLTVDPATGAITGTPTVAGRFTVTLRVTDADGRTAVTDVPLVISAAPLVLSTDGWLVDGQRGAPYTSRRPSVTGGTGPYTYSASGLPAGLTIDPTTGEVTGTPVDDGTFTVTLTAYDSDGASTTVTVPVRIAPVIMRVTGRGDLPDGLQGAPYRYTGPEVTGGEGRLTYTATGLPPGLSINPTTGEITGTPTQPGPHTVTITITDTRGNQCTVTDVVTIDPAPLTLVGDLPDGMVGEEYVSTPPVVRGLDSPVHFTGSNIPPGLQIDTTTGVISGKPTVRGRYLVTVTATGRTGKELLFTDLVNVGNVTPVGIDPLTEIVYPIIGRPFTGPTPTVTGGNGYYTWSADGLPPGLSINPETGVITGVPRSLGEWRVQVTVRDGANDSFTTRLVIVVVGPDLQALYTAVNGRVGYPIDPSTVVATGGEPAYTFTADGLPPGLILDPATGQVTGTPTIAGTFSVTFTARDATDETATVSATIIIRGVSSGRGPGGSGTPGRLPRTGSDTLALIVTGAIYVALGAGILVARRRRKTT